MYPVVIIIWCSEVTALVGCVILDNIKELEVLVCLRVELVTMPMIRKGLVMFVMARASLATGRSPRTAPVASPPAAITTFC